MRLRQCCGRSVHDKERPSNVFPPMTCRRLVLATTGCFSIPLTSLSSAQSCSGSVCWPTMPSDATTESMSWTRYRHGYGFRLRRHPKWQALLEEEVPPKQF